MLITRISYECIWDITGLLPNILYQSMLSLRTVSDGFRLCSPIKASFFNNNIFFWVISYSTVVLYRRDRYEIIGLHKISHSIKQLCRNVCLEKALKRIKVAETMQYLG